MIHGRVHVGRYINLRPRTESICQKSEFFERKNEVIFLPSVLTDVDDQKNSLIRWDDSFEYSQHMFWLGNETLFTHSNQEAWTAWWCLTTQHNANSMGISADCLFCFD